MDWGSFVWSLPENRKCGTTLIVFLDSILNRFQNWNNDQSPAAGCRVESMQTIQDIQWKTKTFWSEGWRHMRFGNSCTPGPWRTAGYRWKQGLLVSSCRCLVNINMVGKLKLHVSLKDHDEGFTCQSKRSLAPQTYRNPSPPPTLFSLIETATHYGSQLFSSEPADLLFCPCGSSEEENGPLSRLRVPWWVLGILQSFSEPSDRRPLELQLHVNVIQMRKTRFDTTKTKRGEGAVMFGVKTKAFKSMQLDVFLL